MKLPNVILVPTDFSENAEHALDYAVALAAKLDAKVHLLNVIGMQMFGAEYGVAVTQSMVEDVMQGNQKALDRLLAARQRGEAVYMPVRTLESEHDSHREQLKKIRELTDDLRLPSHACATWTALYNGLEHAEGELMQHIHLENNILFARATGEAC